MKAGETGYLKIKLENLPDLTLIKEIVFTTKADNGAIITHTYPEDVELKDDTFLIALNQGETSALRGASETEAQINFTDNSVSKSSSKRAYIYDTLATKFLDENAPAVEMDIELAVEPVQIVRTGGGGDSYTKSESDARYAQKGDTYTQVESDAKFATKTALAEKADKLDIPTDYATTEQLQAVAEQIPSVEGLATKTELEQAGRQIAEYVDGMPFKTINGESIKGNGNIEIQGGSGNPNALKYILDGKCDNPKFNKCSRVLWKDGDYMYVGGTTQYMHKVNTSGKNPTIEKNINLGNLNLGLSGTPICRGVSEDKTHTYLYCAIRVSTGQTTRDKINGSILILKKSDMSLVENVVSNELYTDVKVIGDYLIASRRTCGWEIFDISNPTAPTSVWQSVTVWDNANECQNIKITYIDNTPIAVVCGFTSYIWFYSLANMANPILLESIRLNVTTQSVYRGHGYDCEIVDNMVYATLSPISATYSEQRAGVIAFDISDILNGNLTHTLYQVPPEYAVTSVYGDAQPTGIAKWGNFLIEPATPKGTYVWKINADKSLTFVKLWQIYDNNGYLRSCFCGMADELNRFIYPAGHLVDDSGADVSNDIPRCYYAFSMIETLE